MDGDIQDAILIVKSSDVREEVLRALYNRNERIRPSKLLESIEPRMNTSSGNFYMNLDKLLEEGMIEKIEGNSRATLYTLTDKGTMVAEELQEEWESNPTTDEAEAEQQSLGQAESGATEVSEEDVDPELLNEVRDFLAVIPYTPDEVIQAAESIKQRKR
ncbi:archaellum operon transcriptional activator EarA family protein [Haloarcula sediminis]|uniref:archaellum operon transcriptional activator EarA family protein n=1 Tax=Haloarcula sediminis TaxID=3111777 RepID=UPI002D797869|nr:archaellum operon transcriptional activator EarA family protein [Haloarcula sp. CK38]